MIRVVTIAVLVTLPMVLQAQDTPPCTYERCALRIEDANPRLPARVVQGIEGRPVGTFGLFSPAIPLLASGPDSVRIPYEAFRTRQHLFTAFGALSLASLIAVPMVTHMSAHGPGSAAYVMLGTSVAFGAGALAVGLGARSKLDEAIAQYNDRLPDRR
ncbi:MAG TPA: hypothetical protein VEV39_11255 [Gemmatimonadales bacterium]|nr:hypothetical protein [Gemmatimonadales bacterium]